MSYKEEIRQAHIASLKQRFLDLIAQAEVQRAEKQKEYEDNVRGAYIEKMQGLKDRPQYIRSLGMSGGVEELDLEGVTSEYQQRMDEFKQSQRDFIDAYNRTVAKQKLLMQLALDEYNTKIALEDYNEAQTAAKSSAKSGSKGSSKSSASSSKDAKTEEKQSSPGYYSQTAPVSSSAATVGTKKTYIKNWTAR